MIENIIKNSYTSLFSIKDDFLKEIFLINTKCLIDDKKQRYVYIDDNRLKNELIYHKFYGNKLQTKTFLSVVFPVIISNTNKEKSNLECTKLIKKYIKFLKKEEELFYYLISVNVYNSVVNDIIKNKNIEYKEILQNAKQSIIEMNLETNKKEFISFQKLKIYTIQEIDNYINLKISNEENIINNLLKIIYSIYVEDILFLSDDLMAIKKSILSILGENFELNTENIDFILLMGDYIAKLRCYSINKKTYVENSDPRYIINLNENDEIIDPIFGKVYVKSKCLRDNILYVNLKSKSGVYSMRFKKMINYIAQENQ